MDKKEIILWLSLLSTHLLLCFLVRSITTILTSIILEKKTQISRFQLKKLRICSSDVSETFLYKKSRTQVKFFNHQIIASSN